MLCETGERGWEEPGCFAKLWSGDGKARVLCQKFKAGVGGARVLCEVSEVSTIAKFRFTSTSQI